MSWLTENQAKRYGVAYHESLTSQIPETVPPMRYVEMKKPQGVSPHRARWCRKVLRTMVMMIGLKNVLNLLGTEAYESGQREEQFMHYDEKQSPFTHVALSIWELGKNTPDEAFWEDD